MDDLFGLGKGTGKLLNTVERFFGAAYEPYRIRRKAEAEMYRYHLLEDAKTEAKAKGIVEVAKAKAEAELITHEIKQALEDRLQARLRNEALRQQQNLETIIDEALHQAVPESTAENVDEDWLAGFFEHAKCISGAEMQMLWARVLALEVGEPGKFSPSSLEVLRKMTRREAMAFQAVCRLASGTAPTNNRTMVLATATRSTLLNISDTPEIHLSEYGFSFPSRVHLAQMGLLYEDKWASGPLSKGQKLDIYFESTHIQVTSKRSSTMLGYYALTPIGIELSALVASEEDPDYITALCNSLSKLFEVHKQ